ncbi:MAG: response regulator transcription factor [Planctomycetaceae bacterium]|nr:response regulator transcription factor [Planctomycetaceae bacterium]
MMTEIAPAVCQSEHDDRRVVYLVDNDEGFRESMVDLLKSVELDVIDFASPLDFLEEFEPERAGCIMLDIRMPEMSGLDLHTRLHERDVRTPVIIITGYGEVSTAVQALKSGAVEYIEKSDSEHKLLDRVQAAMRADAERRVLESALKETLIRYKQLTPREREILAQVATGRSSREIADYLKELKQKTVEAHRARIMRKMEAPNVAGLVRMYLQLRENGLVDDPLGDIHTQSHEEDGQSSGDGLSAGDGTADQD